MRSLSGKIHRPPIPDLESTKQDPPSSPQNKAKALNDFFVKQTHLEDRDSSPDASTLPSKPERFDILCASPADVYTILKSLPGPKAPGMDGVTTRLLHETAHTIASSLSILFNRSFAECSFPT